MDRSEIEAEAHRFFDGTAATYDRVARVCTWGADAWWKHRMLAQVPKTATDVLEQACGTGILSVKIARLLPRCRIIGVDMEEGYLARARRKVLFFGLANVGFIAGRAEEVRLDREFDCVISSYLAKYVNLPAIVDGAWRMLREGGHIIMHDFTYPPNLAITALWRLHFVFLRCVAARLYPEWRPAFDCLPALLQQSTWVRDLCDSLRARGFSSITVESLTFGTAAIVTARKGK